MTREEAIEVYNGLINTKIKEAFEFFAPELKEGEDEKTRKEIIKFIQDFCNPCDPDCDKWIAYLEKQKSKDNEEEYLDGIKRDWFERGKKEVLTVPELYGLEKQKEQKHPNGCFTCDEYKKGYEEGRRNGFTAGYNKAMKEVEQKEQKPAEVDESTKRLNDNWMKQHFDEYTEQKPVVTLGETYHVDTLGTQQVIAGKMPQKPAEWSEEDEEIFNNIIEKAKGGYWIEVNEICWLITRFKSLRPQPKQEWSEEDEKMLNNIEYILHKDISYTPPTKPNSCTGSGNAYYTHQTEIDWLKSLRSPKSSDNWKPSEEQMKALLNAEEYLREGDQFDSAKSIAQLYEQLKAIKEDRR